MPLAYAIDNLGIFKLSEEIQLLQVCASCTFNNISLVQSPNSTIILSDAIMQKQGINYNYTLAGTTNTGIYDVCGVGDLDGTNTVWCYTFEVTKDGTAKNTNTGLYIVLVIFTVLFILSGAILFLMKREDKE